MPLGLRWKCDSQMFFDLTSCVPLTLGQTLCWAAKGPAVDVRWHWVWGGGRGHSTGRREAKQRKGAGCPVLWGGDFEQGPEWREEPCGNGGQVISGRENSRCRGPVVEWPPRGGPGGGWGWGRGGTVGAGAGGVDRWTGGCCQTGRSKVILRVCLGEVRGSWRCRPRKWREARLQGAGRPSLAKCFKSLCSPVTG